MKKKDITIATDDITDLAMAINQLQTSVDKGFSGVNKRLENLESGQNRIESKLSATVDNVDEHSVELRQLKQRLA